LVNRWIAEGFIYEEHGRSAYEIGERYFSDLANRSLIQPVDIMYGEAQACRVHDIILDFITSKATEENFVTPSLDATEHGQISDYMVRRLFVDAQEVFYGIQYEPLGRTVVLSFFSINKMVI
jgi:hypothetical protein